MDQQISEKLEALRSLMHQKGVDVYLIPRGDEYLGEFVPAYAERLAFVTGFTGSAGIAIVTADQATVMSDGRYTIQLRAEVDADLFALADSTQWPVKEWLYEHGEAGQVVGFDPKLHSAAEIKALQERLSDKKIECTPIEGNLVDEIWGAAQPAPPQSPITLFDEGLAGASCLSKIEKVCANLAEDGLSACFITKPDSVAWLLNIRGHDLDYMPVVLSVVLIDVIQRDFYWFIDPAHVGQDIVNALPSHIKIRPMDQISTVMRSMKGKLYGLDAMNTSYYYRDLIAKVGATCVEHKDPCIAMKARKNECEKDAIKQAHILDGVAICKTLYWLDQWNDEEQATTITEMDVAKNWMYIGARTPRIKAKASPRLLALLLMALLFITALLKNRYAN